MASIFHTEGDILHSDIYYNRIENKNVNEVKEKQPTGKH